jgi:putative nucleotidyltransferase with HDIG domain
VDRTTALELVKKHVKNKNLIKHMLATEAVMGALAEKFGQDAEKWKLAGLLHDIDYDQTAADPDKHSVIGAQMLEDMGVDPDIVYAVRCHNEAHGDPRNSLLDKSLYAADPVTGFIVAGALIHPSKKLASIDVDFLQKRFKESSFAKGANRQQMASCSELDLDLPEFLDISLKAIQGISDDLGL